ncbi:B12-binding domain-containing radical SAM protein [Patescibacteria group bacterium]|nr:B12-binding domain-containing radical SAM protein [Patescibacteria group bacterium]MBU2504499.1 B12-binding domain-containing radical SAM protein [Candidatus Omnitrophota bacterium]
MKITILLCPSLFKRCPLIGLGYLSAYLKAKGHQVTVLDLNTEMDIPEEANEGKWNDKVFVEKFISENNDFFESLSEKIVQSGSDIIGFSVWATTKYTSLALAGMIKQKDKDKLIVFGGPECSFTGDSLIRDEAVDMVVCGEGEETFARIAHIYEREKRVDFCPGALLKNDGDIIDCGFREEIENLNSLPYPDYSDFSLSEYYSSHLPMTFYRGCLNRCVFCNCAVTWKKFRSRTAKNIYQEMISQIEKYPNLHKFGIDDTALNLNLPMLSELCDLILTNGLKMNWGGAALIRKEMSAELIEKMAKAGCNCIGYGLESGSQKIVDRMGKGFSIEDAERVIRDTYNAGIETILGIIIGFPGETDDDFQETMNFLRRNKRFISKINFPGECCIGCNSYMLKYPEKFNVILDPDGDGERWWSKDGKNTHDVRQRRKEVFNEFLGSLDLASGNYTTVFKKRNFD